MKFFVYRLFFLLLFATGMGCSSDDDAVNNPGGGNTTNDPVSEAMISQGLAVTNAMFAMAPQWASGNLVGPPAKDAIFNPACQCWTWQIMIGDPFANPFDYTSWDFRATFYAGELVVPEPQNADRAMIEIFYSWFEGFYTMDDAGDSRATSYIASLAVSITPVGGDPVAVSGSGVAEFTSNGTVGGTFFDHYGQFGINMELSLPLTGCPSGMMTVEEDLTLFSVSYDGTTTAFWTLAQGEAGNPIQGSETIVCGATN